MNRLIGILLGLVLAGVAIAAAHILQTPNRPDSVLERLAWLASITSAVIAVPLVVAALLQLSDIKHSLRSESFEATAQRISQVTELMLEHPADYTELKSGANTDTAMLLAERILDVMDTELLRRQVLTSNWEDSLPTLRPWFKDLFTELPGLRLTLHKRRDWYSDSLYWLSV